MGWVAAGVVTSVVGGVMSYNASKKAGKKQQEAYEYQAKVNQRNAKVLDAQALLMGRQSEYDIQRFRKNYRKFEGSAKVAIHKSGFRSDTGTGLEIMLENAREAQDQIDIQRYNTRIEQSKLNEEALQQRMGSNLNVRYGQAAKSAGYASGRAALIGGISQGISYLD